MTFASPTQEQLQPHRLALLDVDGTLRHGDRWNDGALELMSMLHAAGVRVALCSGRTSGSMTSIVDDVPDVDYVASSSGATVLRRGEGGWDVLAHRALPRGAVELGIRTAREEHIEVWAFTEREWLIEQPSRWASKEAAVIDDAPRVAPLLEYADDIGKVLFLLPDPARAEQLKHRITWPGAQIVRSGRHYLDLVTHEAHDAKGGDVIRDELGLDWPQILAVGDSENDRGMLSLAGVAVCIPPIRAEELGPSDGSHLRLDAQDTMAAKQIIERRLRR